jgi:hypothetical protein
MGPDHFDHGDFVQAAIQEVLARVDQEPVIDKVALLSHAGAYVTRLLNGLGVLPSRSILLAARA